MSFNGSGTFQINSAGQPVVAGTVITAAAFNALTADLATGLSTCMTKDGQTSATANIPMGNNKFTGLSAGTAATDSVNLGQVQGNVASLISVAGIDTITGSMSPTLTAYATGAMYWFVAAGTNTGAVTLNIDGLGAKSVTRDGSTALIAGDIANGQVAVVVYDGTRFQLQKANAFGTLTATTINTTNLTATGTVNLTGATVSNGGSVTTIDINGGTVDGVTIGGASAGAATFTNLTASGTINFTGATVSNLGSVTTADINGGTVDGVTIGGALAGAGTFTNLTASGTINFTGATVSNGGSVTTVDINGGTIDGAIIGGASAAAGTFTTATVGAGLVGTPSLTTTGDTNTGLYFPAADTIAATTNGSERLRINSTGQVLIGYTDAINVGGVSNQGLQVTGGASQRITTVRYGNDANPASIFMGHSRAAAAGSNTIVQSGDQLGAFRFLGDDGTQFAWAATISGEVDGTPGVNDMPGRLVFFTTPDGASNPTERMRITSSGNVGIGTSSPTFKFVAANSTTDGAWLYSSGAISILGLGCYSVATDGAASLQYDRSTGAITINGGNRDALNERMRIDANGNVIAGGSVALATNATSGFLYVPTCAGTPTGTPAAITGMAPIVVNTTNNKLYFYSGGAWRDAGP